VLGVTELISVLVTAAVTFVSTLRWPTLRRRVRDHVALLNLLNQLKELPTDAAEPLQGLLKDEVQQLADRDGRHLSPRHYRKIQLRRVLLTVIVAAASVVAFGSYGPQAHIDLPGWLFLGLYAVVVTGLVALPILVVSFVLEWLHRGDELPDAGPDTPKAGSAGEID
jgi:hypothetical protein